MKILLFKIGAIGDTLMTTPLIRQLRNNFPDAHFIHIVRNGYAVSLGIEKLVKKNMENRIIFWKKLQINGKEAMRFSKENNQI